MKKKNHTICDQLTSGNSADNSFTEILIRSAHGTNDSLLFISCMAVHSSWIRLVTTSVWTLTSSECGNEFVDTFPLEFPFIGGWPSTIWYMLVVVRASFDAPDFVELNPSRVSNMLTGRFAYEFASLLARSSSGGETLYSNDVLPFVCWSSIRLIQKSKYVNMMKMPKKSLSKYIQWNIECSANRRRINSWFQFIIFRWQFMNQMLQFIDLRKWFLQFFPQFFDFDTWSTIRALNLVLKSLIKLKMNEKNVNYAAEEHCFTDEMKKWLVKRTDNELQCNLIFRLFEKQHSFIGLRFSFQCKYNCLICC